MRGVERWREVEGCPRRGGGAHEQRWRVKGCLRRGESEWDMRRGGECRGI